MTSPLKNRVLFISVLLFIPWIALAQSLPPPEADQEAPNSDSVTPEEFIDNGGSFTGTLEDAFQEEEQFLETEETESLEGEVENGTHLLKFEFTSLVQFTNPGEPSPYMEVQYTNTFETPVAIIESRSLAEANLTFDTQNWGFLAHNEFFECKLDIAMQQVAADITTRLLKGSEGNSEAPSAVVKISLKEEIEENWFSLCNDITGATLNTQGAPERYNMQILKSITPSLSALMFENFSEGETSKIDLESSEVIIDDLEINNQITLSGEGSLTLEPL